MTKKKALKILSIAFVICVLTQYTISGLKITHASPEEEDIKTDASNYDFYYTEHITYSEYLEEIQENEKVTKTQYFQPDTLNSTYDEREAATVSENENLIIPMVVEESGFYNITAFFN